MKAVTWHGKRDVRVEEVPDPVIQQPTDAIVRMTTTNLCGSDLHLYEVLGPFLDEGDILGHEPMGIVEEVGRDVEHIGPGDRVVVPFNISCGTCWMCSQGLQSQCETTQNREQGFGASLFGYTKLYGQVPGGQAEYLRVPFADVAPVKVPDEIPDEKVLFLSDVFPTAYMAAENAEIEPGDTVAVWGCGPVGILTIDCAWLMGAGRVIAIDRVPERLQMASEHSKAETINYEEVDVYDRLQELTGGRGPDRCIDAVGSEAHHSGLAGAYDKVKQSARIETDRPHVFREALKSCRKGGTLSVPGVYIGFADKIPLGTLVNKAITIRTGQTHVPRYTEKLLGMVQEGVIDPSHIITHTEPLEKGPELYKKFRDKEDGCIKVVLKPFETAEASA